MVRHAVPEAIHGNRQRQRNMIRVPLREERTLHHDIAGRHGAGKVELRSVREPALLPAARCAPCLKWVCKMWSPNRSARPTPII